MKKYQIIISVLFLVSIIAMIFFYLHKKPTVNTNQPIKNIEIAEVNPNTSNSQINKVPMKSKATIQTESEIPLKNTAERITKKPFGIFITPANSPVQPEGFMGYHTGTDFEILSGEEKTDVEVRAICDGKIIYRNSVNGYGGVIIQSCSLNNENVTVLYGHISLTKSSAQSGKSYKSGDSIAILGQGYSTETDRERKHLHLGIHKGNSIELQGYAGSQSQLSGWIDFQNLSL